MAQKLSDLNQVGLKLKTTPPIIVKNVTKMRIITELLIEDGQFLGMINNILGIAVFQKEQIQPIVASNFTYG